MTHYNYQDSIFAPQDMNLSSWNHTGYINFIRAYNHLKKIKTKIKVLDIGCGAGGMLYSLQKALPQNEYWGIDISQKAIEFGKKKFPSLNLACLEVNKTTYPDKSFDFIILSEVLEHVPDPALMLAEIKRLLTDTGELYLTTPLEKSLVTLQGLIRRCTGVTLSYYTTGHINFFNEQELQKLLNTQFSITKKTYSQHLLWQLTTTIYQLLLIIGNKQIASSQTTIAPPSLMVKTIACITNGESQIFQNIPGSDIQILAQKKI